MSDTDGMTARNIIYIILLYIDRFDRISDIYRHIYDSQ